MPHIVHPDFGDIGFVDQSLKRSADAIIRRVFALWGWENDSFLPTCFFLMLLQDITQEGADLNEATLSAFG